MNVKQETLDDQTNKDEFQMLLKKYHSKADLLIYILSSVEQSDLWRSSNKQKASDRLQK